MRPQKVLDKEILASLTKVFRSKGYEGASLSDLAAASGLKKASLYHRFPGGKEEMANAVLNYLDAWVSENIFYALNNKNAIPEQRLKDGLKQIGVLYDQGNETCIFRALSMQAGLQLFEEQLKNGMKEWISALKGIGVNLGLTSKSSEENAIQTLVEIQGSLIVSRSLNNTNIFENTLQNIEKRYLKK